MRQGHVLTLGVHAPGQKREFDLTKLADLTLTLGSDRVAPVPWLIGVRTETLRTHRSRTRSNTKLL